MDKKVKTEIEQLVIKYKECEFFIPEAILNKYDFLQNISFMIISPDAVQRGLVEDIIDFINEKISMKLCLVKVKKLSNRDIEYLYKYSLRRKNIENEPVYWWLLQESLQIGPSIVMVLYSEDYTENYFCEKLVQLKGGFAGENGCDFDNTIRSKFSSFSRILNTVHCSDDIFAVFREALLFFSEEELDNSFSLIKENRSLDFSVVGSLLKGVGEVPRELDQVRGNLLKRIMAVVEVVSPSLYKQNFDTMNGKLMKLQFDDFIKEINELKREMGEETYNALFLLYTIDGLEAVPFDLAERFLESSRVYFSDFEKVIIKNIIIFRKWEKHKVKLAK